MIRLAWLLWALPLAYVLPAERVLEELERQRPAAVPLHLVAEVQRPEGAEGWPERVDIDLHPTFGARFLDSDGGRYVVRGGRLVASNQGARPDWIPQLEPLVIVGQVPLEGWLEGMGVAWTLNELGRCGRDDCFVLGGRRSGAQLWIDKESLEVRRFTSSSGRWIEFAEPRDFGGVLFPSSFGVYQGENELATWTIQNVYSNLDLGEDDFSPRWTQL